MELDSLDQGSRTSRPADSEAWALSQSNLSLSRFHSELLPEDMILEKESNLITRPSTSSDRKEGRGASLCLDGRQKNKAKVPSNIGE